MFDWVKSIFGGRVDPNAELEHFRRSYNVFTNDANRLNVEIETTHNELVELMQAGRKTEALSRLDRKLELENARTSVLRYADTVQKAIYTIERGKHVEGAAQVVASAIKVVNSYKFDVGKMVQNLNKLEKFNMRMDLISERLEGSNSTRYTQDEREQMLDAYVKQTPIVKNEMFAFTTTSSPSSSSSLVTIKSDPVEHQPSKKELEESTQSKILAQELVKEIF
jgi:hypothetical protein